MFSHEITFMMVNHPFLAAVFVGFHHFLSSDLLDIGWVFDRFNLV